MGEATRRRFTLSDAIVLVAAVAVGLAGWRALLSLPLWAGLPDSPQRSYFHALATSAVLAPLSVALLILSLRAPRPRRRRLAGHPAFVVGLSVLLILAVNSALLLTIVALTGSSPATFTGGKVLYFCRLGSEQVGAALACSWTIQAVSGRCRGRGGWLAGLGWALGFCWVVLAAGSGLFTLL